MNISELSVRRPIFMSCVLVGIIAVGYLSLTKLPVDLFPDVTFPVVTITTVYPGAAPNEVESLLSKPLEEEVSGLSGIKTVRSINSESLSVVVAEFTLETDVKYAEQQIRDRTSAAKRKLPSEIEEPVIRRIDPADQPIMKLALKAPLAPGALYDLANEEIRPQIEQVARVGRVDLVGGRKREIQVQLDREKLRQREIPAIFVAQALKNSGQNIPAGKVTTEAQETVFRTIGEFESVEQIKKQVVSFIGNDVTTTIGDVGSVVDTLKDEETRAYYNGEASLIFNVFKQTGTNTIKVSEGVEERIKKIRENLAQRGEGYDISVIQDSSKMIRANVYDVQESIVLGIILTVIVVFFFLGSMRSTLITGLAIPVSIIGGMTLIYLAGFSINVLSLLALSLAVGLLIDDAIVVRENIFRHLEMGKSPIQAALDGSKEVGLAVIAVTLAILAVFAPIGFLPGVVGQFMKSFGLSVCFVMIVSLFDALSNAPMLSAYLGGRHEADLNKEGFLYSLRAPLRGFGRFQDWLEVIYVGLLEKVIRKPGITLLFSFLVVILLGMTLPYIPKTFLPPQDNGEFSVSIEMPTGTSLEALAELSNKVDDKIRKNPQVKDSIMLVGATTGVAKTDIIVHLIGFKERSQTTTEVKDIVRKELEEFSQGALISVKDIDNVAGGQRPFNIFVRGQNLDDVRKVSTQLFEMMKSHPAVSDPEITDKVGFPEFQVKVDLAKAQALGVTAASVGAELRAQVEGIEAATYRENGLEYDIRVRMKESERNLESVYSSLKVPNINGRMVNLSSFSEPVKERGLATINRENRARYIGIGADIKADSVGMGGLIADINKAFKDKTFDVPEGVTYRFSGQAENFQELIPSMQVAGLLGLMFIFLVLASLYESVVTPFTIMLVIPFAVFGGFLALFLTGSSLDLFSMIGSIMLMGLATKNSIIMVDYINQKREEGKSINDAIIEAGKTRLRPILMTSFALIAGMMPVAIGLNEASKQRTSLGIAVVGGVLVSTALTLLVIPAVYNYIERFRQWMIQNVGSKIISK